MLHTAINMEVVQDRDRFFMYWLRELGIEKGKTFNLFWSIVVYDADTRCIIDNRSGAAGGKATAGSKTKGLRMNADGSYYVLLGPDAPPKGWEANHVQTLPGRGWFPYMRMYGAT
jgi:hypothetical protein